MSNADTSPKTDRPITAQSDLIKDLKFEGLAPRDQEQIA